MRNIIIICLLVVAASADNLDFNYLPVGYSEDAVSFSPTQMNNALYDQSFDTSLPQGRVPQPGPGTAEYEKEFYSFSAPEEFFDDIEAREKIGSSVKKNLRVLFIRTPENKGLEEAAVNLIKQSSEDHTAIYVLAKQTDVGSLAQRLETLKSESQSKPEVHFIKYRTSEDAAYAQRAIQDQYNSLPGDSRSVNGGQANVLNFAVTSTPTSVPVATSPSPTNDYLPPYLRRSFRKNVNK